MRFQGVTVGESQSVTFLQHLWVFTQTNQLDQRVQMPVNFITIENSVEGHNLSWLLQSFQETRTTPSLVTEAMLMLNDCKNQISFRPLAICLPTDLHWLKRPERLVWEDDKGGDECDDSLELLNYQCTPFVATRAPNQSHIRFQNTKLRWTVVSVICQVWLSFFRQSALQIIFHSYSEEIKMLLFRDR